jgi:hypothetical protein
MSYWPRTRWPRNPSRYAELTRRNHPVRDRHGRLDRPAPGGRICSRSSPSILPINVAKVATLAWTHVDAVDDAAALDYSWQLRIGARGSGPARSRPSPRRRQGRRAASSNGSSVPGALRTRSAATRSAAFQSMSPRRGRALHARRPRTVAAAPARHRPGSRPAESVAAPGRPGRFEASRDRRPALRPGVSAHATPASRSTTSISGNSSPNIRSATARKAPRRPWSAADASAPGECLVRRLVTGHARVGGRAAGGAGRLQPLTDSNSASEEAVAVAESTIATPSPTQPRSRAASSG